MSPPGIKNKSAEAGIHRLERGKTHASPPVRVRLKLIISSECNYGSVRMKDDCHYPCCSEHSEVFNVRVNRCLHKVSRVGGKEVFILSHRSIVTLITYIVTYNTAAQCRCHVTVQISFLCLSKRACTETAALCQTNSMMCPRAPIKLHNPRSESNSTL